MTLLVPGAMSAFGTLTIGSLSIVAIALAIGLGGSVASRTMDALYGDVPHLMRGRVISRNELFFQLANVTGAAVAVLVYPGPRVGFAARRRGADPRRVTYASELRLSLRKEAGRWLLGQRPRAGTEALPLALLAEAMRFTEQGDHYVVDRRSPTVQFESLDARPSPPPGILGARRWEALADTVIVPVVDGTLDPTTDDSMAVINAAGCA